MVAEITACCWQKRKSLLFTPFSHHPHSAWVPSLCIPMALCWFTLPHRQEKAVSSCQVNKVELGQPNLIYLSEREFHNWLKLPWSKTEKKRSTPTLWSISCQVFLLLPCVGRELFFLKGKAAKKIKVSFPWPFLRKAARSVCWEREGYGTIFHGRLNPA